MVPISHEQGAKPRSVRILLGYCSGLAMAFSAALYTVLARYGAQKGLASLDTAFIRYVVAGSVCAPFVAHVLRKDYCSVVLRWRVWLALAMLAGPFFGMAMFSALKFAPASHASVFPFASISIAGTLFSVFLLGDRLSASKMVGIAIVVTGLLIASHVLGERLSAEALIGDLLFMTAGAMWAGFGTLCRKFNLDSFLATALISVTSLLTFGPVYLAIFGVGKLAAVGLAVLSIEAVAQGLIGGIGTLYFYAKAAEQLGAARAAIFPALAPGIASLISWPVLGHIPDSYELVGVVLVVMGLCLSVVKAAEPAQAR